jgi:hypothetical protein
VRKKKKKKKVQIAKFATLLSSPVPKSKEGSLKICIILFLVYNHIWLNLPWDDSHFFYIFRCMITHFGHKQKFPQKNTGLVCVQQRGEGARRGTGGGDKQSVNAWFPGVVGKYQIVNQSVVKYPSS